MKWTKERSARAHAAKARHRIARVEAGLTTPELIRVPQGEYLGTLQWHDASGQVRRWIIRQGSRANNITVRALVSGHPDNMMARTWTWLFDRLRRCLAIPKRIQR